MKKWLRRFQMKSVGVALLGLLTAALKADTWERPHPVGVSSPSKLFIAQVLPRDGNAAKFDQAITNRELTASVKVSTRQPTGATNLAGEGKLVFRSGPSPRSEGSESVTYGQLSVTPDCERLCLVTPSAGAAVFDAGTGKRLDSLGGKSAEGVFLPDGRWFVRAGDKRNPVSIRAVLSGEQLMQTFGTELPRGPKMETVAATQFENRSRTEGLVLSDDGALLAAPTTNGLVVFDLNKTELRASFEFRDAMALPIAFTPDGKALLVGCAPKNARAELKLMRIADRTELSSITRPKSRWPGPPVGIGHYDEDGGHDEVTGSRFRICELARFSSHAEMLALVQAEPQDDRCLVEVWEISTGSLKFSRSLNFLPTQAGFVADSLTLAVTGVVKTNVPSMFFRASKSTNPNPAHDLVLINARNGEVIRDFHLDGGAMRNDRSMLFNGWGGGGTEMGALVGCLDFAVSPDGKLLAVASMDTFIHMIDLEKAAETTTFRGHTAGVARVAFHPSGQRLYSLDTKGEVRAWPVADPLNRESHEPAR